MYSIFIKALALLISIGFAQNFLNYKELASVLLIGLSLSFFLEIKNNKLAFFVFILFFISSVFYPNLIFAYPLVIQASPKIKFLKPYFLITPLLCFFIVKDVNFNILLTSLVLFIESDFEIKFSNLKREIYEKDDDFNIKLKEQKNAELEILNSKNKDIEIAILSERNRISREIHDSVGHTISGAIIQVEAMRNKEDKLLDKQIDALQKNLKSGMADIRSCLHALHDESIDLELAIKEILNNSKINFDLNYKINSEFTYQVKYNIISIIKEAIANSLKHSNASKIKISLIEMPKHLNINIEDNGKNISKNNRELCAGLGFISFNEFAKNHNGRFKYNFENGLKLMFLLDKEFLIK